MNIFIKKLNIFIVLFALILGSGLSIYMMPNRITNNISQIKTINTIYNVSFSFDEPYTHKIDTYFINRKPTTEKVAEKYREVFGITEKFTQDDDKYMVDNKNETLQVLKNVNMFIYNNKKSDKSQTIISNNDCTNIIKDFLVEKNLEINCEEVLVKNISEKYKVSFINKIGNLKNFSFPNNALLDNYGNIIEIQYYFINYKKLKSVKIKSMEEAFREISIDLGENITVDLQKCELVYFYEDSIIQPAYLFTGKTSDFNDFECFIKATV